MKHKYAIKYLCSVLELNRLSYYYFLNQTESEEEIDIKENILEIFKSSTETYGRKRITAALNQKMHANYNVKKIRRLMIELDLQCVIRRKKKYYPKVKKDDIAENLLNRNFKTTMENEI